MKVLTYKDKIKIHKAVGELLCVLADKGYTMSAYEAHLAWKDYSESHYASWLVCDDDTVEGFIEWLSTI